MPFVSTVLTFAVDRLLVRMKHQKFCDIYVESLGLKLAVTWSLYVLHTCVKLLRKVLFF